MYGWCNQIQSPAQEHELKGLKIPRKHMHREGGDSLPRYPSCVGMATKDSTYKVNGVQSSVTLLNSANLRNAHCRGDHLVHDVRDIAKCSKMDHGLSSRLHSGERDNVGLNCCEDVCTGKGRHVTGIQEFYRGTNILITGGTGFMGKVLIEKLLYSCPHINMIYMLVRNKKGKNSDSRVQELFQDKFFSRLRNEYPNFREKIRIIHGDCSEPGLGLNIRDRAGIMEHVHVVFHVAATVRFDEKFRSAVATNIMGTRDMMLLCRDCRNLKAVLHVSTAYSHCYRTDIGEEFYTVPLTSERALKMVDCLDDDILSCITPLLLDKWPNTYTFTKAIAEEAVRTVGKTIPVGIFRPSIVVCTRKEPLSGWIDNLYGPTGAVVGVGMGMIRTMKVDNDTFADIVPCDMAINALIASAWDVHEQRRCREEVPIYNFVCSPENPITWGEYINRYIKLSWKLPFSKSLWMLFLVPAKIQFVYLIYQFFLHTLPAMMIDLVLFLTGNKPTMLKTYQKLHKFTDVISYFCLRQWKFSNQNVQQLWQKLSPEDQKMFDFNIGGLDWDEYFQESLMGIRTHLLKDDPKTIPDAMRRRHRLYWLHQFIKYAFLCFVLWTFWNYFKSYVPVMPWETDSTYITRKPHLERPRAYRKHVNN